MNDTILPCLFVILSFLFSNWQIRFRFVVEGFKHSGSYAKKKKEYRKRWNLISRSFLIPIFKQNQSAKYIVAGILNYIHFGFIFYVLISIIMEEILGIASLFGENWQFISILGAALISLAEYFILFL